MLYKHKCLPVFGMRVIVMTLKRSAWRKTVLQVERANTKSNTVYKKEELQLNEFTDKTIMSDTFEFGGEGEMDPTSSVTFSTLLRITWSLENRRAFVFIKKIHYLIF